MEPVKILHLWENTLYILGWERERGAKGIFLICLCHICLVFFMVKDCLKSYRVEF